MLPSSCLRGYARRFGMAVRLAPLGIAVGWRLRWPGSGSYTAVRGLPNPAAARSPSRPQRLRGAEAALPADPLAVSWAYQAANLPSAWQVTGGSPGVVIAIMDSRVDATRPDLAGAVDPGWNFVDERRHDRPRGSRHRGRGHRRGPIQWARRGRSLLELPDHALCGFCGPRALRSRPRWRRALDYAVAHGAAVVNMSLYGESLSGVLHDAIHRRA